MASVKNGRKEHGSIEVYFAKKLANNDKKIRDRAVKRMRVWLSGKPGDTFTDLDILKLWKGLFYCMWFSDKPFVQEDLADSLAKLIHSLNDLSAACKFLDGFLQTIGREWHGIDRLRLDKFYMLMRKVVKEALEYLQSKQWRSDEVDAISAVLGKGPCDVGSLSYPDGVRMFISDIFIGELGNVIGEQPSADSKSICKIIEPFIMLAAQTKNIHVFKSIETEIFKKLLEKADEDNIALEVDFKMFGERMYEEALKEVVPTKRRKVLLHYTKLFREMAAQKEAKESITDAENAIENEEVSTKKKNGKKSKKRKLDEKEKSEKKIKKTKKKKETENASETEEVYIGTSEKDSSDLDKTFSVIGIHETDSNTTKTKGQLVTGKEQKAESIEMTTQSSQEKNTSDTMEDEATADPVAQQLNFETSFAMGDDLSGPKKGKHEKTPSKKKRKSESKHSDVVNKKSIVNQQKLEVNSSTSPKPPSEISKVEETAKKIKKSPNVVTKRKSMITRSAAASQKKKVVFELSKNAVTSISNLKVSPAAVFTPDQKPAKGVLKRSTPRRRASDFF